MDQVGGHTLDRQRIHPGYENTAQLLDGRRLANELQADFSLNFFIHSDLVKINMDKLVGERVALDVLNQYLDRLGLVDAQVKQRALTGRGKGLGELVVVNRDALGVEPAAIDDRRQLPRFTQPGDLLTGL